ncbi:helix-turn-helix domain-containing protein [Saccharopolyspora shandongensis]|uniref:helix-turn-helix domain-containing protein n=1 Tax=Saccharopolyspora shandongensis TaxID=418495 RepID=UPI00340E5EC9
MMARRARRLPTVRSRRLGGRMRAFREAAGLDQASAAAAIGVDKTYISKFEQGRSKFSPSLLQALCDALKVPPADRGELESLAARADVPGWWQEFGDILAEPVQALIELEEDAQWLRTYEGTVIPGLLQTRAYAEAIVTASAMHMRVDDIHRYVELRMRRQKHFFDAGRRLTAVIGEMALRQQVGGRQVLRDQLRHVMDVIHEHDVTVQVVPFTAGAHAALTDQFVIIEWSQESDPEAVYIDGQTSWTFHEGQAEIRRYGFVFASVQSIALSAQNSLDLIRRTEQELSKE